MLLASIDLKALAPNEVALVVAARLRQHNHETAQLMAAAYELALCPWRPSEQDPTRRLSELDEHSADQLCLALSRSRYSAEAYAFQAQDLIRRLPQVFDAMLAGRLD